MKRIYLNLSILIIVLIVVGAAIFVSKSTNERNISLKRKAELLREQKEESLVMREEDPGRKYVEGELLVKFKEGTSQDEIEQFVSDYNLQMLDIIKGINVYRFKIPADTTVEEMLEKLNQHPYVKYAEPNYIYKLY